MPFPCSGNVGQTPRRLTTLFYSFIINKSGGILGLVEFCVFAELESLDFLSRFFSFSFFCYFTIFSVQEEATDDMLADFEREATLLSEFDHPNIGNPHSDLHWL
jgi:hypothetical protein